jgi:hypothetical protein
MGLWRWIIAVTIAVAGVCAQTIPGTPDQNNTTDPSQARRRNDLDVPSGLVTVRGILIDGGCRYRQYANLRKPPETLPEEAPAQPPDAAQNNPPPTGAVSVKGISVNASTIDAERTGVMETHVAGMFERQSDPTCAVTGSTTSFAILTDDGHLVDLDPGGNTLALVAVQATDAGRAMLNGLGPGVKPRVVVKGQFRGDRLVAQDLTPGS